MRGVNLQIGKQKVNFNLKDYGIVFGFMALCIIISIATPTFFTWTNIMNLLRQTSVIGIIAIGTTFVIISGNFDLSVGATASICGMVTMSMLQKQHGIILAIAAALLVGCIIGYINGFLVAKVNIPSLIATMAMVLLVKGIHFNYTHGGYPVSVSNGFLDFIKDAKILTIPIPVILFFAAVIIFQIVLLKTKFGRRVYSVGGNQEASRYSGIKVDFYKISVFVLNGFMAALAGIVLCARVSTASFDSGTGYDLDAIASVVIGGTSASGGEGSVLKTLIGVLLMSVISNSFNLLGLDIFFNYIFKGLIILCAVGFSSYTRKKASI